MTWGLRQEKHMHMAKLSLTQGFWCFSIAVCRDGDDTSDLAPRSFLAKAHYTLHQHTQSLVPTVLGFSYCLDPFFSLSPLSTPCSQLQPLFLSLPTTHATHRH